MTVGQLVTIVVTFLVQAGKDIIGYVLDSSIVQFVFTITQFVLKYAGLYLGIFGGFSLIKYFVIGAIMAFFSWFFRMFLGLINEEEFSSMMAVFEGIVWPISAPIRIVQIARAVVLCLWPYRTPQPTAQR